MLASNMILEKRQTVLKTEKIVVIEDETDILEVIAYNLKREGYEVITSTSGEDGLEKIEKSKPNLVVLDLMLPEVDKIVGLELGADDYVTKPFSLRELTARIRAIFRRAEQATAAGGPSVVDIGAVQVDLAGHRLLRDGRSEEHTSELQSL